MRRPALLAALAVAPVFASSAATATETALRVAPAPSADPAPPREPPAGAEDGPRPGALSTTEPLGAGNVGMSMGGGVAVLLPFYGVELGLGLPGRVDLTARFETVIGVFHYPHIGVRWNAFDLGRVRIGTRLDVHYSFFGIQTDQLNFTSTFYLSGELGASGPVSEASELFGGVAGEFDFFEYRVVDDEGEVIGTYRYDATVLRFGLLTRLTDDLDGYAQLRVRVPIETFVFEAQQLYVVPLLEIGGSWSF
jgi:hypothetical protein